MMVKSSPAATSVMSQSQFLVQLFVVSLGDQTMVGYFYQLFECGSGREGGACGTTGKPSAVVQRGVIYRTFACRRRRIWLAGQQSRSAEGAPRVTSHGRDCWLIA